VPTTAAVWQRATGGRVYPPMEGGGVDRARGALAFHRPLEFPDVTEAGGFDVVLGNPPWEVVQLVEEEYFSQRLPEIAELTGARRGNAIAALEISRPGVFLTYLADKRRFEAVNQFARASGRFRLTAAGKINTYALFSELALNLVSVHKR
jgi:hypothetical protein